MKKRVTILVQGGIQNGAGFSIEINHRCEELERLGFDVSDLQFTTASDGRQTCNIIYEKP